MPRPLKDPADERIAQLVIKARQDAAIVQMLLELIKLSDPRAIKFYAGTRLGQGEIG